MALFAFGINHKTASVEVREKVAFSPDRLVSAHQQVCSLPDIREAVIVSTCNRSEIYCYLERDAVSDETGLTELIGWLAEYHGLSVNELNNSAYLLRDGSAIEHLAKVASGLDSMVLGEPQILGQLKSSYAVAQESHTVGQQLNRLFQHSFAVAKHVRTHTAIGENPVSVAYAAVSLSTHIFSDLSQCCALLIGAGETIDLVARHLCEKNIAKIIVANRTLQRAQSLAEQFGAEAIMLGDIPDYLHRADIVISSTASQLPILGKGAVEVALKKRKHAPMFMVDIAVPRDIEPQVSELADVYLYTVDDLREVIDENMRSREEAATEAREIVQANTQKYLSTLKSLAAVDTIKTMRLKIEEMKKGELEKALKRMNSGEDPAEVLQGLANGLTNKFAHAPSAFLRKALAEGRNDALMWVNEIFELDDKTE
ncbi:glutamyl-tRNA reductase [Gynuella sp.]|uniref:glutamyl-tRNA reductase n=1 Tax=Gynuella sp. TaxID=2969146 RepID=UPI003D1137AC